MADPLSLIATIGGLVGISMKIASEVNSISESYSSASGTLSSLSVECSVTTAVLRRLQDLLSRRPELLSTSTNTNTDLQQSFEIAVQGISKILTKLGNDIRSITKSSKGNTGGRLSFLGKAKFVFNEDDLKLSLQNLQGQRSSLQFLIECIQTETLSNIQTHLQNGKLQTSPPASLPPASHPIVYQNAPAAPTTLQAVASTNINQKARAKAARLRRGLPRMSDDSAQLFVKNKMGPKPGKRYKSTPSLAMKFHRAIDDGNNMAVAKYIRDDRVDPNILLEGSALSPLHRAIQAWDGKSEERYLVLNCLLIVCGDLNVPDPNGLSPLSKLMQTSISNLTRDLIQLACENGARPELPDRTPDAKTPLHWIIDRCDPPTPNLYSIYHILIAYGADIDALDAVGESVLLMAVSKNHADLVGDLVEECGADTEIGISAHRDDTSCQFPSGYSPLLAAVWMKSLPILYILINGGANIDRVVNGLRTAVQTAVVVQATDVLKFLISKGANLCISTSADKSIPIHYAADGRLEALKILVDAGSPLEVEDYRGETPLIVAIRGRQIEIVRYLISKRANLEHKNNKGFRPLHIAVVMKNLEVVKCIIEAGVVIDAPTDINNVTALHLAVQTGLSNIVEYLVDAKSSLETGDKVGETPLFTAIRKKNINLVKYLKTKQVNLEHESDGGFRPLHIAVVIGDLEVVQYLVEAGVGINFPISTFGSTPLHLATEMGFGNVINYLVSQGANLEAELYPPSGQTPIFLAVNTPSLEIMQLLIGLGANVWKKSEPYGYTVFHAACSPVKDDITVIQFLLAHGFDVNIQAKNGVTGLHFAALEGHVGIVKFLLQNGARTDVHATNIFETKEDYEAKANEISGTPAQLAELKGFKDLATIIKNGQSRN